MPGKIWGFGVEKRLQYCMRCWTEIFRRRARKKPSNFLPSMPVIFHPYLSLYCYPKKPSMRSLWATRAMPSRLISNGTLISSNPSPLLDNVSMVSINVTCAATSSTLIGLMRFAISVNVRCWENKGIQSTTRGSMLVQFNDLSAQWGVGANLWW